jgi:hypothetical protein
MSLGMVTLAYFPPSSLLITVMSHEGNLNPPSLQLLLCLLAINLNPPLPHF